MLIETFGEYAMMASMTPEMEVKKSPIVIVSSFLALQFVSIALYVLAASLEDYGALWESLPMVHSVPFAMAQVIAVLLAESVLALYIFLSWYRQAVRLTGDQLIYDEGLILRSHTVVPLSRIATATFRQNILGRLTRYGTLEVRDGHGAVMLRLIGMSDPKHFVDHLMERKGRLKTDTDIEPHELIHIDEHEQLERKSTLRWDLKTKAVNKSLEKATMKTVAAFMNSKGGNLLLGIGDGGEVIGMEHDYATLQRRNADGLQNHFTNVLSAMLGPSLRPYVRLSSFTHEGKECMLVSVSAADRPAYLRDQEHEEFFIRTGNGTTSLKMSEANSYIASRFGTSTNHTNT